MLLLSTLESGAVEYYENVPRQSESQQEATDIQQKPITF